MKRLFSWLLASLLLGCGPQTIEPVPDIPQTVEYDTVKIDYAGEDGVDREQSSTLTQAIVGDSSELAALTRQAVFGTNRAIYRVFEVIDTITALPPTRRGEGWWVWEGQFDAYVFLRIDEIDEQTLGYTLRWGTTEQQAEEVFSGWFSPVDDDRGRQQGSGLLRIDFDALNRVDPTSPRGQMVIAFRARNRVRQVRVGYLGVTDGVDEPLDAIYRYVELPGGRGDFVFFGHGDFADDGRPHEFLSVNTVWLSDRRGRVAARIEEGSFDRAYTVGQCWDATETVVWAESQPQLPNYDGGSTQDCAAVLGALDLEAPAYEPPNGRDPEVPEEHPAE